MIPAAEKIVLDFRVTKRVRKYVPGAWHLVYDKESHSFDVFVKNTDDTITDIESVESFNITLRDSRLAGIKKELRSNVHQSAFPGTSEVSDFIPGSSNKRKRVVESGMFLFGYNGIFLTIF